MSSIPHLAFPFRLSANGSAEVVEQDTLPEIEQNVKVYVLTERGERVEVPEFGLHDLTFETYLDTSTIIDGAGLWDERAAILVSERPDFLQTLTRNLRIQVEGR